MTNDQGWEEVSREGGEGGRGTAEEAAGDGTERAHGMDRTKEDLFFEGAGRRSGRTRLVRVQDGKGGRRGGRAKAVPRHRTPWNQ